MGNLTGCIKSAGKALDKKDADAIKELRDELKADGLTPDQAAIEAVVMLMDDIQSERKILADAVGAAAHGQGLIPGPLANYHASRTSTDRPKTKEAPEHSNASGKKLGTNTYPKDVTGTHAARIPEGGAVPFIDESVFQDIISAHDWLFPQLKKSEVLSFDTKKELGRAVLYSKDEAKPAGKVTGDYKGPGTGKYIKPAEAKKKIEGWKAHAAKQGTDPGSFKHSPGRGSNSGKVVISLFDYTGEWSQPYRDAGYDVYQFDIQDGQDIMDFSVEYFNENFDFNDVFAIMAACPCTDFASSGSKHFDKKDADGRTEASKELVFQTLRTIEYFRPQVWALENPVGRIESTTGLPPWRLGFQPHNFGANYTKKTLLWGNFNNQLETANVIPTRGSAMFTEYGGKSLATKNARSETPEGFAYSFFKSNNALDMTTDEYLTSKYTNITPAIRAALSAGMSEAAIEEVVGGTWDYDGSEAAEALQNVLGDPEALADLEDAVTYKDPASSNWTASADRNDAKLQAIKNNEPDQYDGIGKEVTSSVEEGTILHDQNDNAYRVKEQHGLWNMTLEPLSGGEDVEWNGNESDPEVQLVNNRVQEVDGKVVPYGPQDKEYWFNRGANARRIGNEQIALGRPSQDPVHKAAAALNGRRVTGSDVKVIEKRIAAAIEETYGKKIPASKARAALKTLDVVSEMFVGMTPSDIINDLELEATSQDIQGFYSHWLGKDLTYNLDEMSASDRRKFWLKHATALSNGHKAKTLTEENYEANIELVAEFIHGRLDPQIALVVRRAGREQKKLHSAHLDDLYENGKKAEAVVDKVFQPSFDPDLGGQGGMFRITDEIGTANVTGLDQTLDKFEMGPKEKDAFLRFLDGRKDADEILDRLDQHAATPWAKHAILGALSRLAMDDLVAGKEPDYDNPLSHGGKGIADNIRAKGAEGIFLYMQGVDMKLQKNGKWKAKKANRQGVIGHPEKPVNAVNGSFIDCDPTKGCATFCYATKGRYNYANSINKSELVTWAVENDPARMADMIYGEYKNSPEHLAKKALRFFDKGDISEKWLPVFAALEKKKVRTQVFSKRPEVLTQMGDFHLKMLSIDHSNMDKAAQYPDLNVAVVYDGSEEITKWTLANTDRVSVILPIKIGKKVMDKEDFAVLDKDKKARKKICPIDAGYLKLGEHDCTRCDERGGMGCFHESVTAKVLKAATIGVKDQSEIDYLIEELQNVGDSLPAAERANLIRDIRSVISKVGSGADPLTEGAGPESSSGQDSAARQFDPRTEQGSERRVGNSFGVTAAQVTKSIAGLSKNWTNGPTITVYQSPSELPANVQEMMAKAGADDIAGYFDRENGAVYLVADGIKDKRDAQVTLLHEAVGHYGIEAVLGQRGFNDFMGEVHSIRNSDPVVRRAYETVSRLYPNASEGVKIAETIAKISESDPKHNLVQRVIQMIRQALRRHGFDIAFTSADITEALRRSRKNLEDGNYEHAGGADGLFRSAYHGSPHRHNKFSTKHIGSGEGNQAYGWGLYFAEDKDIAEYYRDYLTDTNTHDIMEFLFDKVPPRFGSELVSKLHHKIMYFDDMNAEEITQEVMSEGFSEFEIEHMTKIVQEAMNQDAGQLYTVEIPEDHEMLDYDAPLEDQPEILAKLAPALELFKETRPHNNEKLSGMAFYRHLSSIMDKERGVRNDKGASEYLRDIGVPGLKYWDANSQEPASRVAVDGQKVDFSNSSPEAVAIAYVKLYGAEDAGPMLKYDGYDSSVPFLKGADLSRVSEVGSRNFVMFDEARVEITDTMFRVTDPEARVKEEARAGGVSRRSFLKLGAVTAIAGAGVPAFNKRSKLASVVLGKAKALSKAADNFVGPEVEADLRSGDLIAALDKIATEGPSEFQRLAKTLAGLIPESGFTLSVDDSSRMNASGVVRQSRDGGAEMVLFTAGERTGLSYSTILHEGLHLAVMARYATLNISGASNFDLIEMNQPEARGAIDSFHKLYREFTREFKKDAVTKQAVSSPDEFFVRALTDPEFQLALSQKQYQGKTLMDRFKDWVKIKLFKFTGTAPSWLDAALISSNDLVAAMGLDTADFKFSDGVVEKRREQLSEYSEYQSDMFGDDAPDIEPAAIAGKLSAEEITEWRKAHKVSQRKGRVPEVQQAAKDLESGEIGNREHQLIVNKYMPIMPIETVPELTTTEAMSAALATNKAENILGVDRTIAAGTRVASRLDIPAYDFYDTWVVSLHDGSVKGGKSIAYGSSASMQNVEFATSPKAALGIATGNKAKSPFARIHGDWMDVTPEAAKRRAEQVMGDPDWTQVGMNPFRHSYFYNKETGQPVVAAEEIVQIGPLVLAKNVTHAEPTSDEFKVNGTEIFFRVTDNREEQNRKIREEHMTIWLKAKNAAKRQLSPGGLLPREVFEEKIKRDSEMNADELDVKTHVWALEHAFKKDFRKNYDQRLDAEEEMISRALASDIEAIRQLPDATAVAVMAMRNYIDEQSKAYIEILKADGMSLMAELEPEQQQELLAKIQAGAFDELVGVEKVIAQKVLLIQTMLGNVGTYVHRSYRAFDDPQWVRDVPLEVIEDARAYLEGQYLAENPLATVAEMEAASTRIIEQIIKEGTAFDNMEGFIKETKLGAKDLSILKRRKEIAPEIRALMGEHRDARVNFAKSSSKMSHLIFNDNFLKQVRAAGMGVFLFEEGTQPQGSWKPIASDGSKVLEPLNGLYTTPEISQAFTDALGKDQMADWFRWVVQLNGMVKYGKTVLSPTTMVRNFMSAAFFALGNGHFNFNHTRKSINVMRNYFWNEPGEGMGYLRELKALGVVYDTPYAGEMMDLLKDTDIADKMTAGRLTKGLKIKHMLDFATKMYQFGDDFWKIVGFENELALQMKHRDLTRDEAKIIAAERIRNIYPTYSMVGRGVRMLRKFPLAGTFVSFPAEIVRTSYHMVNYLKEDWGHSKALGARRAVGLAIIGASAYGAQEIAKQMLGVDDDEEEAIRQQLPEWSQNSNLLFLSRADGNLRYLDLSFIDPYNYWKRPINAVLRDEPAKDELTAAFMEMWTPFFGTDIAFGTLGEIYANKKSSGGPVFNEDDFPMNQVEDIGKHLGKALLPGAFNNARRMTSAIKGEVSGSGQKHLVNDELWALAGIRISTHDPASSLKYRTYDAVRSLGNAKGILSKKARDPNYVSDAELRSTYERVKEIRTETYSDLEKSIRAARKSGKLDDGAVRRQLLAGGLSKRDASAILRGEYPSLRFGPTYMRSAIRSAADTFGPETQELFRSRRQQLIDWSWEE